MFLTNHSETRRVRKGISGLRSTSPTSFVVVLQVEQSNILVSSVKVSTMKLYLVLVLSLVAFAFGDNDDSEKPASDEIEVEEDVLVLTEANFEKAITDNEHILVEFCK